MGAKAVSQGFKRPLSVPPRLQPLHFVSARIRLEQSNSVHATVLAMQAAPLRQNRIVQNRKVLRNVFPRRYGRSKGAGTKLHGKQTALWIPRAGAQQVHPAAYSKGLQTLHCGVGRNKAGF